jgi:PhnB protein
MFAHDHAVARVDPATKDDPRETIAQDVEPLDQVDRAFGDRVSFSARNIATSLAHKRSLMPKKKIDPLNKKLYGPLSVMLTVADVKAAAAFYQKAFGFEKRGIMDGPDGKAIHAELTQRGTTLMLSPEMPQMGQKSAKSLGGSATTLYLLTEKVDKTVEKAIKAGATAKGPVMDMFWGDRCGTVTDPDGYNWMVATHVAEPTPAEMNKKMKEQMPGQAAAAAAAGSR